MKYFLGVIVFIGVAAGTSLAQDGPPPGGQPGGGMRMQFQMPTFAELDKNKDKKISRDEFPSQFPAQAFDRLDTNHDGFIDEEEWNAMRNRFGGGAGGGGGMGGGPRIGESLTKLLDANADGKISREEFAKVLSLFEILDKDHNGELSAEELNGFFRAVTEAQTQETGGVEVN